MPDPTDTLSPVLREGGCSCGTVRFRMAGQPKWVAHCHCTDCRKATGSAFATYIGVATERFAWTAGQPRFHASSPGVERGFCGACGTPLSYAAPGRWPGEIHVMLCTLDDPGALAPRAHVYWSERVPWLQMDDGLRTFEKSSGR